MVLTFLKSFDRLYYGQVNEVVVVLTVLKALIGCTMAPSKRGSSGSHIPESVDRLYYGPK